MGVVECVLMGCGVYWLGTVLHRAYLDWRGFRDYDMELLVGLGDGVLHKGLGRRAKAAAAVRNLRLKYPWRKSSGAERKLGDPGG